jgi:hypothetical protein
VDPDLLPEGLDYDEVRMKKGLCIGLAILSMVVITVRSATAVVISFTGSGGAVPDGSAAGATFDILINDPRLIAASGNNVTLTLIGVDTTQAAAGNGFGGLVDFTATLQHVGFGAPQFVFANVLNPQAFICIAGLAGSYTFRSGEPTTLQSQCGTGNVPSQGTQNKVIPPGTYRPTGPDDATDSNLSNFWNGQAVAGTWRLFVSDVNVNTGAGQFVMNTNWTWRLDIEVTAAVISFTGSGGAVPDGSATGATFDILINDPRLIAASGNNVTLTLIGVDTTQTASGNFAGFGGLVDFTATLQHVGFGAPQLVFQNVLNSQNVICIAGLAGSYTFRSGAPTTLQSQCGTGPNLLAQNKVIPPGTYRPTGPDDATDSNLSNFWNGQAVAGTWRLFVSDVNVNTGAGQFVMNTNWTWRLDIAVTALGDLNADTVIDAVDARLLLEGLVGLPPAINLLSAGDVNADDAIDNLDSVVIVAIGLGLAPDPSFIHAFDVGNNSLTVFGQANAVPPGSPVNLRNITTTDDNNIASLNAAEDGSFGGQQGVSLAGSIGDTIVADINGSLARVAIPVQPSAVVVDGEGPALEGLIQ